MQRAQDLECKGQLRRTAPKQERRRMSYFLLSISYVLIPVICIY